MNTDILKRDQSKLVSAEDFLTLYMSDKRFIDNDIAKECSILIQLVLTLYDTKITLEKKRRVLRIVGYLKKHKLQSPDDRDTEPIYYEGSLSEQTKEYLEFIAKVIKRVEVLVPTNLMVSTEKEARIILFESPP